MTTDPCSTSSADPFEKLLRELTIERYGRPVRQAAYGPDTPSVSRLVGQADAMQELLDEATTPALRVA